MNVETMDTSRHNPGNDPLEQRIKGLIRDHVYSTELGRRMFSEAKALEVSYLRDCVDHISDSRFTHDRTQQLLRDLAKTTNARIVEGEDNLEKLPKKSYVFAVVNHFSGYKLIAIDQEEAEISVPGVEEIYLPPMFYSSIFPVAERLQDNLYDGHFEWPGIIGQIMKASGLILIPTSGEGRTNIVHQRTKEHMIEHPDSLIVIFAEGGSSGKYNNGGPFDLAQFHKGSFIIAGKEDIPILPVAQFFNPSSGFELKVFEPFAVDPTKDPSKDEEYFVGLAEDTRQQIQAWLDTKKVSPSQ